VVSFDKIVFLDFWGCVSEDLEFVLPGIMFKNYPVIEMECYNEGFLVYASVLVITVYEALWVCYPAFICPFFKLEDSSVSPFLLCLFNG
jgi:hypothetical protein